MKNAFAGTIIGARTPRPGRRLHENPHATRVCAKRLKSHTSRRAFASPAVGINRDTLLDMIDLLDKERRRSENHAFSPQDAARKRDPGIAAHHCATTRSNLQRGLSSDPGNMQPAHISKLQIDACLDILLDCCVPARAESVPRVPAGDIPPALLLHAVQACVRSRVATRTEPDHPRAR